MIFPVTEWHKAVSDRYYTWWRCAHPTCFRAGSNPEHLTKNDGFVPGRITFSLPVRADYFRTVQCTYIDKDPLIYAATSPHTDVF